MALQLAAAHLAAIRRHGESDYPQECCGLLLGRFAGERRIVDDVHPMRNANTASPENRFDFDPKEHLAAQRQARERGLEVVGFYSYLIIRIQQGRAQDANSYELAEDRSHFIQEPLDAGAAA
jgi:hypothetical protein